MLRLVAGVWLGLSLLALALLAAPHRLELSLALGLRGSQLALTALSFGRASILTTTSLTIPVMVR